jgi:hypothetical protein
MIIDTHCRVVNDPEASERRFWEQRDEADQGSE